MKHTNQAASSNSRPTFTIACWLMALIAFAQLISVGTALTVRKNLPVSKAEPRVSTITTADDQPIQPRSLAEIERDYAGADIPAPPSTQTQPHLSQEPRTHASSPIPPVSTASAPQYPAIANPRVERLVQEARTLHLRGDMMRAMLKLDEAARLDPSESAVIYQKGLLFEDMGIFPKAADQYQQIQQLGIKAGVYYRLAARKLTKGMDTWRVRLNALAIGPIKTTRAHGEHANKQARVTIPLLARPDKPIDVEQVEVQVHFYDKLNGQPEKAAANSEFVRKWVGEKIDWRDPGNEETLVVDYTIPDADLVDSHLLGKREFYGCVVELIYQGEIIDQQASPRHLNSIHGSKVQPILPGTDLDPWLPSDSDNLLPNRSDYGNNPSEPPLPSR